VRPADEAELSALVREAATEGTVVRALGSGHSQTPLVATEGRIVSLDALAGVESSDPVASQATIAAGTVLHDLGDPLLELGLAMANLGDIDRQSLGGALATGTHGTGVSLTNLSGQVVGLRLVDGQGTLRALTVHERPELLRAARVALGAVGIVTAATLQLVPCYRLHERIWRTAVDACLDDLEENVSAHRHFEFFWYPHKDVAEQKGLSLTEAMPDPMEDRKYERIGWAPHIIPSVRDLRFVEMEYAVPAASGPECFQALRERMRRRHPEVMWPVEYRRVAADDAFLSTACGRETATISVHQGADLPWRDFFRDVEPIFWEYEGRPHWGKIHSLRARELAGLYPEWERFARVREELDPAGCFLNDHLKELLL